MAGVAEGTLATLRGVRACATDVAIEGLRVRLWRAADLAEHVDGAALLRDADPPEPPYWMHLWPGALALARIVAVAEAVRPGVRLLELGCGLALPALVAARRGAQVLASDRERAPLEFARRSAASGGCVLDVAQMDWGAPALRAGFDICVGADVGYDSGAVGGLVATLTSALAPGGVIWLADSVNAARPDAAEALAAAGFAVWVSTAREWEDGRPVWVRIIEARREAGRA
jgi:predicted nicotinamide N-methyase